MNKVSQIIPSNSRIEAVDLSKSRGQRNKLPGVESPASKHSERLPTAHLSAVDRIKLTDEYKLLKPDELRHKKIAENMADKFFKTYTKQGVLNNQKLNSETTEQLSQSSEAAVESQFETAGPDDNMQGLNEEMLNFSPTQIPELENSQSPAITPVQVETDSLKTSDSSANLSIGIPEEIETSVP